MHDEPQRSSGRETWWADISKAKSNVRDEKLNLFKALLPGFDVKSSGQYSIRIDNWAIRFRTGSVGVKGPSGGFTITDTTWFKACTIIAHCIKNGLI